jgi:CRISPR/Cas system CMR-associated protein Cmr1 (group 7 of RAMP superfamily)
MVAGIFVTSSHYQIGAIKTATHAGIEVAVCEQNQSPKEFVISYKHYSKEREKVIQNIKAKLTGTIQLSGTLGARVIRADGSIEEL